MEIVLLFSDLSDSARHRADLRRPFSTPSFDDLGSSILAEAAALVQHLRASQPEFAAATEEHPDSYWPLLVVVGDDDERESVVPGCKVWRTASGRTAFHVGWDYGVLWATSNEAASDLIDRAGRLLAHWADLRAAIESTRRVVDRIDSSRVLDVRAVSDELREQQLQLMSSMLRADQRCDCVWEYEIGFLTAARTAWDIADLEASAQRTIAAAHAHLDHFADRLERRTAEQVRSGIATVRQLLLLLTMLGGLATVVSIIDFAVDPQSLSPRNVARVALVATALGVLIVLFRTLRRTASDAGEI